jgi:hypothetical protein
VGESRNVCKIVDVKADVLDRNRRVILKKVSWKYLVRVLIVFMSLGVGLMQTMMNLLLC